MATGDRRVASQPIPTTNSTPDTPTIHQTRAHYHLAARRTLSLPERRYLESRAGRSDPAPA